MVKVEGLRRSSISVDAKGIPLLLQLLEYAEFVNCKNLRDPQNAEWWRGGIYDALMKLVPRAGGLDLESYPLFRQLMGWKDAQ